MTRSVVIAAILAIAGLGFMFGAPVIAENADRDEDPIGLVIDSAAIGGKNAAQEPWRLICDNIEAHRAARLGFAAAKLKLTENQESAWSGFVETIVHAGEPMRQFCDSIRDAPEPTALPDRVAWMERIATIRTAELQQLRPAITEFYGILDPDQKAIADGLLAPHRRP